MKTIYLVLILVAVMVLGWAIHYYSDRATFGPAAPSSVGITTVLDARVV